MNQEEGLHQTPNMPVLWSWTSCPPELYRNKFMLLEVILLLLLLSLFSRVLCATLCDSIGGSPPGPPVPGMLQARTLEWVAISVSNV